MNKLSDGAQQLQNGIAEFKKQTAFIPSSVSSLEKNLNDLSDAVCTLSSSYEKMDSGIKTYTASVDKIADGFKTISDGAKSLKDGSKELSENGQKFESGTKELNDKTTDLVNDYFPVETKNLTSFLNQEDNPRIKAANDDVEINITVGLFAGIVILLLITYVISVFVVHSIDVESGIIGSLYSLGVKRKQLMLHYITLPTVVCLIGGIIGTFIGYSKFSIDAMSSSTIKYYSVPQITTYIDPLIIVYGIVVPPLIAFIVTGFIIRKRLNRTALSLLRKTETVSVSKMNIKTKSFTKTFTIRQMLREKRSCFAVLLGMFVSMLVLFIGIDCFSLCTNEKKDRINDTTFNYTYQYKYPTKEVPSGGCESYIESLSRDNMGYSLDVPLVGINKDNNKYLPKITSNAKDEISVSSSLAEKFGVKAGDELVLYDKVGEKAYAFKIKEVVPYNLTLSCFMDIKSMRELFSKNDDFYNVVYSDKDLKVDSGRIYSITTSDSIKRSVDIFISTMTPMMVELTVVSILLFLIVLYQMTKVMIDRSSYSIALMKIFGYRKKEIRKLYLDGNFVLIAVGALIVIPIAKFIIDKVYPYFVSNVSCGINIRWALYMYPLVYFGSILSFFIIRAVLVRKLNKTSPTEVLNERE